MSVRPSGRGQVADFSLRLVDHVAAGFRVLPVGKSFANRPDASADAVACLDDRDGRAHRDEVEGGGETREAGSGDEHGNAGEIWRVRDRVRRRARTGRHNWTNW